MARNGYLILFLYFSPLPHYSPGHVPLHNISGSRWLPPPQSHFTPTRFYSPLYSSPRNGNLRAWDLCLFALHHVLSVFVKGTVNARKKVKKETRTTIVWKKECVCMCGIVLISPWFVYYVYFALQIPGNQMSKHRLVPIDMDVDREPISPQFPSW
ncbi:hypothetical protein BO85DRAFT_239675 [Aspergillus piperis CBS 112811]|uniref:Uncharacterized protein n=1 Tax=Aspergillus piperis CBS 112811 TaxID=1448313 RepID=A0A8G1QPE0_9EURO|nr:hypothetical protein BO85DRAFT_239675 [Aspergillus piperis CBS 112811]RAH51776.1 hypothetical protein BO85DRAFT_239675 [Aspergillus piperis CBS 112811]